MKLTVAAVGRVKTKHFAAACAEYEKRLGRYASYRCNEVKDVRGRPLEEVAAREGEALVAAAPSGAQRIVLDERGELLTSMKLARRLEQDALHGRANWAFLVGGADGHSDAMRQEADWVWSLSPLTMPHELARVVLLEQLYRAMTILRGEQYHREG